MSPQPQPQPPRWEMCAASARGSAHPPTVPNQDAVAHAERASPVGALRVVAVSDGHGDHRYVRSERGARFAVAIAVEQLAAIGVELTEADELPAAVAGRVPDIVAAWVAAVRADAGRHPFTSEEQRRAAPADLGADPVAAYGATLLLAVIGDAAIALAQLGDGDIVVRANGVPIRPVPGDERLAGGVTTSLCTPGAAADFRHAALGPADEVDLVLVASDGYGNSFAVPDWWQAVADDLWRIAADSSVADLERQLPAWLADSARVGGDDATVAVALRADVVDRPQRDLTAARHRMGQRHQ